MTNQSNDDNAPNEDGDYVEKGRSMAYLEHALRLAKDQLPGWAWAVIHQAARSHAGGKNSNADLTKNERSESTGDTCTFEADTLDGVRVVFVVDESNELEKARGRLLVGADGVTFRDVYLKAIDVPRSQVAICTVPEFRKMKTDKPTIALGKSAKKKIGKKAHVSMPHPTAVRKKGDSGEVARKSATVRRILTKMDRVVYNKTKGTEANGPSKLVEIAKADEEKQIVYGVVLDPYRVDAHGDLVPPAEVEKTAHGFVAKSRIIGLQHKEMADATLIESWLVPYPSDADYKAAMKGEPHKASRMAFGDDEVHSGAWIVGTKLGDAEWQAVKEGKITAYSIGGVGKRRQMSESEMPKVEFVEMKNGES